MVTVCLVCGDRGYEEALIYCDSCEVYAVHRYCLERIPRDFKQYITWFCPDCDRSEIGSEKVEIDQTGKLGSILKKIEQKKDPRLAEKNKKNRRLARVEDHTLKRGTNVEPMAVRSSSIHETPKDSGREGSLGSGRHQELYGLKRNEASGLAAGITSRMAGHDSSANNRQRKSTTGSSREGFGSSTTRTPIGAITGQSSRQLRGDNRQLTSRETSCKEAESHTPPLSEGLAVISSNTTEPNRDVRVQPIIEPVWRGSLSANLGTFGSVILVAHLSSIACLKVHDAAKSLPRCLCAEIFPRLDIWPQSFLRSGGPTDESIGLFFFPSGPSDEKVFYALVDEIIEKDLAMRIVLDNAELILFSSYMLPMQSWRFQSKFFLWGAFRGKQALRHQSLPSGEG
ncbi:PREDICTED: uncharacterized protein LOC104806851 [Tarenaya hassleriana]|uniref:uncharacterized protein LOC104806851 n=1 Tax=Tarenaya hassleriana TaxID=28532 RepID=UPI00053C632B|nr:PREDICTED: uncharacterized protein LOC104806851 [Tarenaya hassleriana]